MAALPTIHELDVKVQLLEDEVEDFKKLVAAQRSTHAEIMIRVGDLLLKKTFEAYVIESTKDRKWLAAEIGHIRLSQAETKGFKSALGWIIGVGGSIGAAIAFVVRWLRDNS